MEATPSLIKDSGLVTISWKNVPNPTKDDWIGLWTLWDTTAIDPKKYAPVKYQVHIASPVASAVIEKLFWL